MVITQGGSYTTNEPIFIDTAEPVTLDRCNITGSVCVSNVSGNQYGPPPNLTIRDSRFFSNAQANPGDNSTALIYLLGLGSLTAWNCYFSGQVKTKGALCAGGLVIWGGAPGNTEIVVGNCVFQDCSPAIQLSGFTQNPSIGIYGNQVLQTANYQHNDQISLFGSGGVSGRMAMVQNNLIAWNPDAPQVPSSGGIVPDEGSMYVHVLGNLNLNQGIGCYNDDGNGNTSNSHLFENNIVAGLGGPDFGYGLAIWKGGGFAKNNTVLWVPGSGGGQAFYLGNAGSGENPAPDGNDNVGDTGQVLVPASQLTKQYLEDLYNTWLTNQLVGGVTYPAALK
jgi:hypothetical protein